MGGDRRSLIWASFSPSTHWTSRVRSNGQLELQRAETAIHEQPESTKSRSPRRREAGRSQVTIQAIITTYLGSFTKSLPGNRLMSQLSCFLEMLVQLRSRETGCRRMIPLNIRGVMDLQRFRSMRVHNRLSQHLARQETSSEPPHLGKPCLALLTLLACHLQGGSSFKIQPSVTYLASTLPTFGHLC